MKNTTLLCALAVAALFAGRAEAIYKCTTPKGVVYQDRPCKEGAESDVSIVMNTTDLGAKAGGAVQDDSVQSNAPRSDTRSGAPKTPRTNDDSAAVTRAGDNRATNTATSSGADAAPKLGVRFVESLVPMTADDARRTEPSAKYYTNDAAAPDTPEQMTCESPNGQKRRFILSNGKMTSI